MQIKNKPLPKLNGSGVRVGVAVSRFNRELTKKLVDAAVLALKKCQVKQKDIQVFEVPGAMELPYMLQAMSKKKNFDCLVALGCIIRGDTPHFDYVCKMAQEGALRVSLDHHLPIGFGVLTVNTQKQAEQRIHVGAEAALAALELAIMKK